MAKDGDIIDTMLGWLFELVGWVFGMLVTLVVSIIGGLFKLIVQGLKTAGRNKDLE